MIASVGDSHLCPQFVALMQCLCEMFMSRGPTLFMLISLLLITYACSFTQQKRIPLRLKRTNGLCMVGLDSNSDIQGVAGSNSVNKIPRPGDRKTLKRFMQVRRSSPLVTPTSHVPYVYSS